MSKIYSDLLLLPCKNVSYYHGMEWLRMEEIPPDVQGNILKKQFWIMDKEWSASITGWLGVNYSSPQKISMLWRVTQALGWILQNEGFPHMEHPAPSQHDDRNRASPWGNSIQCTLSKTTSKLTVTHQHLRLAYLILLTWARWGLPSCMSSQSRPGVATTISGLRLSKRSCFWGAMPPTTTAIWKRQHLTFTDLYSHVSVSKDHTSQITCTLYKTKFCHH